MCLRPWQGIQLTRPLDNDIDIFVNCSWVTPDGSGTVHIYTQTIHRTTRLKPLFGRLSGIQARVRAVPRLCEFYLGICLTTEEEARENLTQGSRRVPVGTMETEYTEQKVHDNNNT
jgi:hypothetical protein